MLIFRAWATCAAVYVARESLSPVSLAVFSLAPDFSLDLSCVLDCEKILTVLSVKAYKRPLRSVGGS